MEQIIYLLLIGLAGGLLSGLVGLGGGVIVVPGLVMIMGLSQHAAQGTTLAMMIPPVGILAVLNYYKQGNVNFWMAGILCLGFVVGGFFGSRLALSLDTVMLKKIFAGVLIAIGLRIILFK